MPYNLHSVFFGLVRSMLLGAFEIVARFSAAVATFALQAFPPPNPAMLAGNGWRPEREVRISLLSRASAFVARRLDRARSRQRSSGLNFGGVGAGLRLAA